MDSAEQHCPPGGSKSFQYRVNLAAGYLVRNISASRAFDTCFEMHDGDLVVTVLVRRALQNRKLWDAIEVRWGGTFPQGWLDTATRYAETRTRQMGKLAAEMRQRAAATSLQEVLKRAPAGALGAAWAEHCGCDPSDPRLTDGWPMEYALFASGWDAALKAAIARCEELTEDELARECNTRSELQPNAVDGARRCTSVIEALRLEGAAGAGGATP